MRNRQKFEAKAKRRNVLLGGTKQYEKELKKNDREELIALFKVKKRGYAALRPLSSHCHHSGIGISMQDTINMNIETTL
jgi:hypothetical protein